MWDYNTQISNHKVTLMSAIIDVKTVKATPFKKAVKD